MNLSLPTAEIDRSLLEGAALAVALGVDPLVEIQVAAALSALSAPEVNAKIREGTYPEPVQIGRRKRALPLSKVHAWNENPVPSLRRTPKPNSDADTTGSDT